LDQNGNFGALGVGLNISR